MKQILMLLKPKSNLNLWGITSWDNLKICLKSLLILLVILLISIWFFLRRKNKSLLLRKNQRLLKKFWIRRLIEKIQKNFQKTPIATKVLLAQPSILTTIQIKTLDSFTKQIKNSSRVLQSKNWKRKMWKQQWTLEDHISIRFK
jgi:hypothetical protein